MLLLRPGRRCLCKSLELSKKQQASGCRLTGHVHKLVYVTSKFVNQYSLFDVECKSGKIGSPKNIYCYIICVTLCFLSASLCNRIYSAEIKTPIDL